MNRVVRRRPCLHGVRSLVCSWARGTMPLGLTFCGTPLAQDSLLGSTPRPMLLYAAPVRESRRWCVSWASRLPSNKAVRGTGRCCAGTRLDNRTSIGRLPRSYSVRNLSDASAGRGQTQTTPTTDVHCEAQDAWCSGAFVEGGAASCVAKALDAATSVHFDVCGDDIDVETAPGAFYERLLHAVEKAKRRIVLTSLYLGTGERERKLVSAITKRLQENPQLEVTVVLDYARGTRGSPNSVELLHSVAEHTNARVCVYRSPDLTPRLERILRPPFNEVVGLQHTKLYIVDDTTVISGANLSKDYFTQRQDRYVFINDACVSSWYSQLAAAITSFSHRVSPRGFLQTPEVDPHAREEVHAIIDHVLRSANPRSIEQSSSNSGVTDQEEGQGGQGHDEKTLDTRIYPLVQMGPFNVRQEQQCMTALLHALPVGSHIDLATGYFNLSSETTSALLHSQASCRVVCASPQANGFLGAKGPRGHIPAAYTHLLRCFLRSLPPTAQVEAMEYEREGWTFHAKGIWVRDGKANAPCVTVVGSSNFGERSASRDLEVQAVIVTRNRHLMSALDEEVSSIVGSSERVTVADLETPERRPSLWEAVATSVIRSFL